MTDDDTLSLLDGLVAKARSAGADAADAVAVSGESISIDWRHGALEHVERSEGSDIGLRVLIGHRQAAAASSDRSAVALTALVERVIAMARVAPEDETAGLAEPGQLAGEYPDLDLEDPVEPGVEVLRDRAAAAEAAMLAVEGVSPNSDGAGARWGRTSLSVAASNGFSAQYSRTGSAVTAVALAGEGTAMETDYDSHRAVHAGDLEAPDVIGRRAGERAVAALNARKIGSQKVPVMFDRRIAASLLGHLAGGINGQAVARGTSFLKDKMGEQVFADGVCIIDNPRQVRGLASTPFDGEGLPAEALTLVDNGVLQHWLLNLATARQLGLKSNGRGTRSIGAAPGVGSSNLYMQPGTATRADMIKGLGKGLLVTHLIGQGVNLVTGSYSRGCTGFWIENGEIAYPVSEITIAGTLQEMFRHMQPADDLEFRAGVNAPSILIEGMTVAGA